MLSELSEPTDNDFIPLSVPDLSGTELSYLQECISTNWLSSSGPFVHKFETELAKYVGVSQAVATSSGTAALHIALLIAGIEPNDEVLLPTLTFIAPANAVRYCGAWPVFIDADPKTWQMDVKKAALFIDEECMSVDGYIINRNSGRRVKAILPVHLLGHPVDMAAVMELADKNGLHVIEDATESLGTKYYGQMLGSIGHVGVFSFNGNKLITSGGGGAVVTESPELAARARYLSTQAKEDSIEYIHHEIGYNYRLTNVQAAIGLAQIEDIDRRLERKRAIAKRYQSELKDLQGITTPVEPNGTLSSWWLYTILVEKTFGIDSRSLLKILESKSIQARPLWQPLHRSPAHNDVSAYGGTVADHIYASALSLPSSVGLSETDISRVTQVIKEAQ